MRKKLLGLCLVLSLGVLSACGKGDSTGAEPESVQAVVEATTEQDTVEPTSEGVTVSEETTTSEPEIKTVYLLSKEVHYGGDTELLLFTEYEYNDQGNLIKKTGYDETGAVSDVMEYDIHGNQISEIYYREGSVDLALEYKNEYDDKGCMVKTTVTFIDDGALRNTMEYEYDSKGNLIKEVEYFADGNEGSVCEYDDKGNMTKLIVRIQSVSGEIVSYSPNTTEYEYDSHDNITKQTTYTEEGTFVYVKEYEYDDDRIMKKTNYEEDGSLYSVMEYEYDSHDNLIKEVSYDEDGSEDYIIEYEYIAMELAAEQ